MIVDIKRYFGCKNTQNTHKYERMLSNATRILILVSFLETFISVCNGPSFYCSNLLLTVFLNILQM